MKSILDKSFKYTPSSSTDIRKTFARVRREFATAKALPKAQIRPIMTPLNAPRGCREVQGASTLPTRKTET